MAERMKSVFGNYADRLQAVVDNSLERFSPVWFVKHFDWGVPTMSLDFKTVIGRSRIEAAASVVDRNSSAPLRARAAIEKLQGTIPAIKEKFKMDEEDYRNWEMLKAMSLGDGAKKQAMLDLMFNDVQKVGSSAMKRLDYMILQGISTGKIDLSATNNPDGIVTGDIDLLMPAANKSNPVVKWSSSTTSTPIEDIRKVVRTARAKGISFAKILMTEPTFWNLQKTDEAIKLLAGHFRMSANQKQLMTMDQVNQFLTANLLPMIEIVDEAIGIESDGKIGTQRPFNEESVVFIPSDKLGIIHNAIAIEELKPVTGVAYAKYQKALISKWSQNDPFSEFTGVELNAFPGFETIDQIYIIFSETVAA